MRGLELALTPAGQVRIDHIAPDPDQPRRLITPDDLAPLVLSIRAQGVIQPILLSPHPVALAHATTPFMIVSGERRWAAARGAGLQRIPANLVARALTPAERLMVQLSENDGVLRRELSLLDRVDAILRAFRLSEMSKRDFAASHGRSPGWLSNHLALAEGDAATRDALTEGRLTGMSTALLFLRLGAAERSEVFAHAHHAGVPITAGLIEAAAQRQLRKLPRVRTRASWAQRTRSLAPRPSPAPADPDSRPDAAATAPSAAEPPPDHHAKPTIPAQANPPGAAPARTIPAQPNPPGAAPARTVPAEKAPDRPAPARPVRARSAPDPAVPERTAASGAIPYSFSPRQLENLLVLLGQRPGPTPREQLLQLESLLA